MQWSLDCLVAHKIICLLPVTTWVKPLCHVARVQSWMLATQLLLKYLIVLCNVLYNWRYHFLSILKVARRSMPMQCMLGLTCLCSQRACNISAISSRHECCIFSGECNHSNRKQGALSSGINQWSADSNSIARQLQVTGNNCNMWQRLCMLKKHVDNEVVQPNNSDGDDISILCWSLRHFEYYGMSRWRFLWFIIHC